MVAEAPARQGSERAERAAVQAMVSSGGVAALSWEVLWQHHAALSLGASAAGTALVLATAMAGSSTSPKCRAIATCSSGESECSRRTRS